MRRRLFSTYSRKIKQWIRKTKLSTKIGVVLSICLFVLYAYDMNTKRLSVDTATYSPLMNLIGQIESNDNYNAYYGKPENTDIQFTNMSVAEVMKWQEEFVASGSPSSAVGRYQIINTTLTGLVRELSIDTNQTFDKKMQDRMAIALFERRGSVAYVNKELTAEEFAASLAKEWAALPKVIGDNPESSYYANDGLNNSRTKPETILGVVNQLNAE